MSSSTNKRKAPTATRVADDLLSVAAAMRRPGMRDHVMQHCSTHGVRGTAVGPEEGRAVPTGWGLAAWVVETIPSAHSMNAWPFKKSTFTVTPCEKRREQEALACRVAGPSGSPKGRSQTSNQTGAESPSHVSHDEALQLDLK